MYIKDNNGGGYFVSQISNTEFVNPIDYDFSNYINMMAPVFLKLIRSDPRFKNETEEYLSNIVFGSLSKLWLKRHDKILAFRYPEKFYDFLTCNNKRIQERILKNQEMDSTSIQTLIYTAWREYGFKFSFYRYESLPDNIKNRVIPEIVHLQEDNKIHKIGFTDMSDGELRSMLTQRSTIFAKFLDNGAIWHCFLYTYDGIVGKEVRGNPHIHYISSAFGDHVTRERVLKEISKGKYNLPSMIHIKYTRSNSQ